MPARHAEGPDLGSAESPSSPGDDGYFLIPTERAPRRSHRLFAASLEAIHTDHPVEAFTFEGECRTLVLSWRPPMV